MQVQTQASKIGQEVNRFTGQNLHKLNIPVCIKTSVQEAHKLKEVGEVQQGKYKNQSISIAEAVSKTTFYVPYQIVHFFILNSRTFSDQHLRSLVYLLFNTHISNDFGVYAEFLWMLPSLECWMVNQTLMSFLSFAPSFLLVFNHVLPKREISFLE